MMTSETRKRRLPLGVTLVLSFVAGACSARLLDSIRRWSWAPLVGADQVVAREDGEAYLVVLSYGSGMAFGSGNKVVRVHSPDGSIVDEILFGEFPLEVVDWASDTITLAVPGFASAAENDRKGYV